MFRLFCFLLLSTLLLAGPSRAQTVTPVPATAAPGTTVVNDFDGLTSGFRYRLYLEVGRPYTSRRQVDDFTASSGSPLRKFIVPTDAPIGAQFLVLYRVSLGETQLYSTDFTVVTGPSMTLTPNPVNQGRSLRFSLTSLRAGTLTVKFDGETVFGPVTVGDGNYSGKFIVPRDRPTSVPSTVTVRAENRVGRSLVGVASRTVQVQGPVLGPMITSTFTQNPPTRANEGTRFNFAGRLSTVDGQAVDGDARFYWKSANGRVVPLDGEIQMASDGTYSATARAPSFWLDGISTATGEVVAVVKDRDPDTEMPRTREIPSGRTITTETTLSADDFQFVLKLVGPNALGNTTFIDGAYVEVTGDLDGAFSDPNDGIPGGTNRDTLFAIDHQLTSTQTGLGGGIYLNALNGCPITFARKFTNGDGEALFEYNPEQLRHLLLLNSVKAMGEIRLINRGMPVPGIDTWENMAGGGLRGISAGETVQINLRIHAGQQGYGETGMIDDDGDPSTAMIAGYQPTDIGIELDLGTGQATLVYGPQFGGSATLQNNLLRVELPPLSMVGQVVPRNLRVQGLTTNRQNSEGYTNFEGMYTFPSSARFPDAVFVRRNAGREIKFEWEAGFGAVQNATLLLKLPGDSAMRPYGTFAIDSETACNVSGLVDYVATLPDMTRLPANQCFAGKINVDRNVGPDAFRMFKLCTLNAPGSLDDRSNQYTLRVDALANAYQPMFWGDLTPTEQNLSVSDPEMNGYGIPRQDNIAANGGDFEYRINNEQFLEQLGGLSTDHVVASNDTDGQDTYGMLFGFDPDVQSANNIDYTTILDTGRIPLFRYPWGAPPIAGATLGADFWLASELGLYGRLGSGSFVDASIDPSLAGGVDMFFDLDVLFGLVSASVTASPYMDLLLRDTMGNGGLYNPNAQNPIIQQPGACFTFALDITIEVCALFCGEDTFEAFSVSEGDACTVQPKSMLDLALADSGKALRLERPRLLPNALAVDAYGRQLVVRVDSLNRLRATHLDAGGNEVVRTIDSATQGVQHIDVTMFTNGRALAVWSESTLTSAQLDTLMRTQGVRNGSDDLARAQVLRFSRFDGTRWTTPELVPVAQTGVGKPKLTTCRWLLTCFRSDIAFLVWEYDANQNIANPDIEIWGSEWRSNTFAARIRISNTGTSSDMGADVGYLGSDPIVTWLTNPSGGYNNLASRQIAYRILDTTQGTPRNAVQVPPLPVGAAWPSIRTSGSSTVYLAYTISTDGVSVLGNRNALQVARGTCDSERCTFENTEPRDPHGRRILGERPTVMLDGNGQVVVGMRGLGYARPDGANPARSDDLPGMLVGTGELVNVRVPSFGSATTEVAIVPLSSNGLQHFRPQFAFDAAMDAFIGISEEAVLPGGQTALDFIQRLPGAKVAAPISGKSLGDGLRMATVSDLPDLRLELVGTSGTYWTASQSKSVRVNLRNAGRAYDPAVDGPVELRMSWDAPAGSGTSANVYAIPAMPAGGELVLNRTVVVPANHLADDVRTLFVDIVPTRGSAFEDARAEDNQATITKGEMPVPTGLTTRVKTDSPIVGIDWLAPADPRIAGYRVYKRAENGEYVPYGSTPISSFADFFAGFRDVERYRVSSFSARGIESALSAIGEAAPKQQPGLFANGFE